MADYSDQEPDGDFVMADYSDQERRQEIDSNKQEIQGPKESSEKEDLGSVSNSRGIPVSTHPDHERRAWA
jgi:hypothetical protein